MEPILAIVGATATGKSALAIELAAELGGEIVNADALQVYRGFDIGTAKPAPEELSRAPHHLIDILEPTEPYSAGEFARRARQAIGEIRSRGARPLVVGGSGLYLRALVEGLSPLPPAAPGVRERLRQRLESEGLAVLRRELAAADPVTEHRLAPGDTQRVLRALEVSISTGRPQSAWIEERPFGSEPLATLKIGLTLPRSLLYDRIEARVGQMVAAGWVEEVGRLLISVPDLGAPAFQAIGYREIAGHLQGESNLEEALSKTIQATRRFAKRQATWFRKEPDVAWFDALDPKRCAAQVLARVGDILRSRHG